MSASSGDGAEPNLTPILDMVFQLITFFMLVINFKGATMDMSLKLPVLGSARPIDWQPGKEPLVLNIDPQGKVSAYGQPVENTEAFITKEARLTREFIKVSTGKEVPPSEELPTPVIVRADHTVTFHQLNSVIQLCQKFGFRQFQLSAMTAAEK